MQTLFGNVEKQTIPTAIGSISIGGDTITQSLTGESVEHLKFEVFATSAFSLRKVDVRRAAASSTCSQFEIVPNAAGAIVGQVIGNGLMLKGASRGTIRVCLDAPKKEIPLCFQKYSDVDFSFGDQNNRPGVPLQLAIETNKQNRVCGNVRLESTQSTAMVYPVMRTANMQPFKPFVGKAVQVTMKLNIASKELFTMDVMIAFRKSVAVAISMPGLAADAIVIIKVCDASGCISYTSNRRAASDGITVQFEVQSTSVSVDKLVTAMDSGSFTSAFESAMTTHGYTVKAEVVGRPTVVVKGSDSSSIAVSVAGQAADENDGKKTWTAGAITGLALGVVVGMVIT